MDAFHSLLDTVAELPAPASTRRTFMEIAGYPHLENVASNILAHFIDPEAGHGLGSELVLSLLLSSGGAFDSATNVDVQREVVTESGKRIDVLVSADEFVLGIENKIYATLYNDLDDYDRHLTKIAFDRPVVGIVLSLVPEDIPQVRFTSLTYESWFETLLPRIGPAVLHADLQQLAVLFDFINTIKNLNKRNTMDTEFVSLVQQREDGVKQLLSKVDEFQRGLRREIESVADLIEIPNGVTRGLYRERFGLFDILVHDVIWPAEQRVAVDAILAAAGWEFVVFNRRGAGVDIVGVLRQAGFHAHAWAGKPNRFVIPELACAYNDRSRAVRSLRALLNGLVSVRDGVAPTLSIEAGI